MSEFTLEDLKKSRDAIGEIFPVIKDQHGNILDGFHRKRADPNWKETVVNVFDPLQALKIRIYANIMRRDVESKEKEEWVSEARKILQSQDKAGTQKEIAEMLGLSIGWVCKYDLNPTQKQNHVKDSHRETFFGYNVWGFQDEAWRKLVVPGDPEQPDKEYYHGSTPAFVIHQLIQMFQPKSVLDNMAGVGTTGYVCRQYGIECDQFDLYPYEKYGVQQGDAESITSDHKYDMIFNHIPYLDMVHYGDDKRDLSTMNEKDFFDKMKRILQRNYDLLSPNGIYVILVGDWRFGKRLIPITAKITLLAHESGFFLQDEAIKLTSEQKGLKLQEYRASKFGYLAQTFDMVLIFRRAVS